MPCLTPSARAVLAQAFDPSATFSDADIATITPVASAIAVAEPADERTIRQSVGTLAAAMPAQASDAQAGKLKLNAYVTMLEGIDQRALSYACRRCMVELDWMPTVKQIIDRAAEWVSEDEAMIRRARVILRAGRREMNPPPPLTADGIRALPDEWRRLGVTAGFITQADVDDALRGGDVADGDRSAYVPDEKAA